MKTRDRKRLLMVLITLTFFPLFFYYANFIFGLFLFKLNALFMYVPLALFSFWFYCYMLSKKTLTFFVAILIFFFVVLFGFLLSAGSIIDSSDKADTFNTLAFYIIIFMPLFLASTFVDLEPFLKKTVAFSRVLLLVYSIAFFAYVVVFHRSRIDDYMTFAYYSLPPFFFLRLSYGKDHSKIDFIILLVSFLVTLLGGCRGALLTIVAFLLLMLLFGSNSKHTKKKFF